MKYNYVNKKYDVISDSYEGFILNPKIEKVKESLIFLHGLGDRPENFFLYWFIENDFLPSSMRIILPSAPLAFSSLNKKNMNSWFDIKNIPFNTELTYEGNIGEKEVLYNSKVIKEIMDREIKEYLNGNSNKLFVGGISQGCALALHCGLQYHQTIGGIIAISGFLLKISEENDANKETPILLTHGKNDPLISWEDSYLGYKRILTSNVREYKVIDNLGHWIDYDETPKIIQDFIKKYI